MALTGSYFEYTITDHPANMIYASASYPSDLPVGDPNYDKRGTTELVSGSEQVITEQETEGVYCIVTACTINQHLIDGESDKFVGNNILYNLYTGSYDEGRGINNIWKKGQISMIPWDYSYTHAESRSLMEYAYDFLRGYEGFHSMSLA